MFHNNYASILYSWSKIVNVIPVFNTPDDDGTVEIRTMGYQVLTEVDENNMATLYLSVTDGLTEWPTAMTHTALGCNASRGKNCQITGNKHAVHIFQQASRKRNCGEFNGIF